MAFAFKLYKRGDRRIVAQTRNPEDAAVLAQAKDYIVKYDNLVVLNPTRQNLSCLTEHEIADLIRETRAAKHPAFYIHV